MPTPIQAVIFDFDETLADTLPGRIVVMQSAVQDVLGLCLTLEQALSVIRSGSNLESQMARLAAGNQSVADRLLESYRQRYYRTDRPPLPLFSGMAEALATLQGRAVRLALVTSRHRAGANGNPTRGVLWELQRMGLRDSFEVVVGYEDTVEHKPDPEPFLVCSQQLGLPNSAIMAVGDSPFDILGARAAGMRAAAALWGVNDGDALVAAGPDIVLSTPDDLVALL